LNQRLNPLKRGTGSNLVDAGRAAARVEPSHGETTPQPDSDVGEEATVNVCGVAVARLQGLSWAPILSTGTW
jgi:hypothetical protein